MVKLALTADTILNMQHTNAQQLQTYDSLVQRNQMLQVENDKLWTENTQFRDAEDLQSQKQQLGQEVLRLLTKMEALQNSFRAADLLKNITMYETQEATLQAQTNKLEMRIANQRELDETLHERVTKAEAKIQVQQEEEKRLTVSLADLTEAIKKSKSQLAEQQNKSTQLTQQIQQDEKLVLKLCSDIVVLTRRIEKVGDLYGTDRTTLRDAIKHFDGDLVETLGKRKQKHLQFLVGADNLRRDVEKRLQQEALGHSTIEPSQMIRQQAKPTYTTKKPDNVN